MKNRIYIFLPLVLCLIAATASAQSNENVRPRIVITADPELDDNNSLIRFLLYSSDLQIEGLIYASSQFHWKGDGKGTRWFVPGREYARFGLDKCPCESWRWAPDEKFIHDVVEAYEKVYPNLKIHNLNYPSPADLKSKIRHGNIEFDGDFSKDTPGSELIKSLILDDKPGKLFITAWGGQSTIARALKSIQDQYEHTTQWESIRANIFRKVVLLPSGDQDDTYAKYIKPHWGGIEYRRFTGGPNYGYGAQLRASPEDAALLTPAWMKANVLDRGVLGSLYRVWGDGKQMVKGDIMDYFGLTGHTDEQLRKMGYAVWMPVQPKHSWLGEGDNHTFMNMLGNGLRAFEDPTYGGWGGRGTQTQNFSFSMSDTSQQAMVNVLSSMNQTQGTYPNFFPAAQNDFSARMKWSVTQKYSDANHEPVVKIEGPQHVMASAGETIRLNGIASDPDNDKMTIRWWQFKVGSFAGDVNITNGNALQCRVTIPQDAKSGQTIHLILEATDTGTPALTRYQRVVVTIREK
ncbi:MAG TPA: nucleoside hydrolase-like domain-containing protein [Chryseolinea sp.]